MQTFIQVIETFWTKRSRGNPGASLRNQVPEKYPFPRVVPSESVLFQRVSYSEYSSFSKARVAPVQMLSAHDSRMWRIEVEQDEASAKILFYGVPASEMGGRPINVSELLPNSWMRIVGNRRVAEENTWAYHKYVYNIFHGEVSKANDLIANKPPVHSLNHEGHLW
jgi:hypothetical protein